MTTFRKDLIDAIRLASFEGAGYLDGDLEKGTTYQIDGHIFLDKIADAVIEAGLNRVDWDAIRAGDADPKEAAAHAIVHSLKAAGTAHPVIDRDEVAQIICYEKGCQGDYECEGDYRAADSVIAYLDAVPPRPVIGREELARVLMRSDLQRLADAVISDLEATPPSPVIEGRCATCGSEVFEGDADAVIAHLDADTVDDRTEWEYGYTSKCGKTATTSRENAERHARFIREEIELGRSSGDLRYHGKVIRRKASKAGEWEEIPNE